MSVRTLRRTFAAPFVVTLALAPAYADTKEPKPPQDHDNPPKPQPKQPPGKNPPGPTKPTPAPAPGTAATPAKVEQKWTVHKNAAKGAKPTDCWAEPLISCDQPDPKVVRGCNPPAPHPYTCPVNAYGIGKTFTTTDTLKIILRVGAIECVIDRPPVQCDPGEKCNPPPPQKIACPK